MRRNVQPSRSSRTYVVPAGRSSTGSARMVAVDQAKTAAQTPKDTASTMSALAAPANATRAPAIAAPAKLAVRSTADASPVDALERDLGAAGEGRHERVLGAVAGSAQPAGDGDQREQHRERQLAGEVQQRDQPDHHHAQQVAGDRDAAGAEPVDQRPGQCLDHDQRQQLGEGDQAGLGGRARGGQHQPRDRDHRDAGAAQRDRVGEEEADQGRTAAHRSSTPAT